jgi:4'-phosphopantetheinyl transferase
MITVLYTNFTQTDIDNHYERLLNSVTSTVREVALRFYKEEDRFRSILGKLLVHYYFKKNKLTGESVQLMKKDSFNRPYISGDVDFNISHSGNYVICAFSTKTRVGVDIEKITSLDIGDFDYIFHPAELKAIKQSTMPMQLFFDVWVKKEAVTKADGRGLGCPLKEIDTLMSPVECSGTLWHTQSVLIHENYAAAIASNLSSFALNIQEIPVIELYPGFQ